MLDLLSNVIESHSTLNCSSWRGGWLKHFSNNIGSTLRCLATHLNFTWIWPKCQKKYWIGLERQKNPLAIDTKFCKKNLEDFQNLVHIVENLVVFKCLWKCVKILIHVFLIAESERWCKDFVGMQSLQGFTQKHNSVLPFQRKSYLYHFYVVYQNPDGSDDL